MTYSHIFTSIDMGGVTLKNRVTMAPIYLGYAAPDGGVSPLMLEHYRSMAKGGAAMVVVENTTIDHPAGSGASRMLRSDTDANLAGLSGLASAIKNEG
jgi:NADPH2 dehydrogenase